MAAGRALGLGPLLLLSLWGASAPGKRSPQVGRSLPARPDPSPAVRSFSSAAPGRARAAAAGQLQPGPQSGPSGRGPPSRGVAAAGAGPLQRI